MRPRVSINGFGRIGRRSLRALIERTPGAEVVRQGPCRRRSPRSGRSPAAHDAARVSPIDNNPALTRRPAVSSTRLIGVVAAAALALGACAGATTPSPAPTQPTPTQGTPADVVEITVGTDSGTALLFEPGEVTVAAGAEVVLAFENRSTVPHNLTFEAPISAATATIVDPGAAETITLTAPAAGEYVFVCTLHPDMTGTLIVQ